MGVNLFTKQSCNYIRFKNLNEGNWSLKKKRNNQKLQRLTAPKATILRIQLTPFWYSAALKDFLIVWTFNLYPPKQVRRLSKRASVNVTRNQKKKKETTEKKQLGSGEKRCPKIQ